MLFIVNFCILCEFRSVFISGAACNNIAVNDGQHCDRHKAFMLLLELQEKKIHLGRLFTGAVTIK